MKKQLLLLFCYLFVSNNLLMAQQPALFSDSVTYHKQPVDLQTDSLLMVFRNPIPLTTLQLNSIGNIQYVESVATINNNDNRYAVRFMAVAMQANIDLAKTQIKQIAPQLTEAPVLLNYVPDSFALARHNFYPEMLHYTEAKNSVLANNHQRRFLPAKRYTIELTPIEGIDDYSAAFTTLANTYNLTAITDTNNILPANVKIFNFVSLQNYMAFANTLNAINSLPQVNNAYLQLENDNVYTENKPTLPVGTNTCSPQNEGFVWHNDANGKIGSWAIGANDLQIGFDSDGDGTDELLSIADNGWATIQRYNEDEWEYVWSNYGNWWLGEVDLGRLAGYVVMQNGDSQGKEHILFLMHPEGGGIGQFNKLVAKLLRFGTTKWTTAAWSSGLQFYDINNNGPYQININPRFAAFDHDGDGKDDLFYLDAQGNPILWYFTPGNAGKWHLNTRYNGNGNTLIGNTDLSNIQAIYALKADSLDTADELLCINTLWANMENYNANSNTWTQKYTNQGSGHLDDVVTDVHTPRYHKLSDLDFYLVSNLDGNEVAEEIFSFEKYANNNWIQIQSFNTHPVRIKDGFSFKWCNWGEGSIYDIFKLSDRLNIVSIKLCSSTNKDLTLFWS